MTSPGWLALALAVRMAPAPEPSGQRPLEGPALGLYHALAGCLVDRLVLEDRLEGAERKARVRELPMLVPSPPAEANLLEHLPWAVFAFGLGALAGVAVIGR